MKRHLAWKLLDNYKRKFFIKNELKRIFFKINLNKNLTSIENEYLYFKQSKINIIGLRSRINNRCIISGRNHNVLKKFNYSRFILRDELKKSGVSMLQKK
jgi:ribosomal protein S14